VSPVKLRVFGENEELGKAAAMQAAITIRHAIKDRGLARIIAATGASQLDFLNALTATAGLDWQKVELFHLDEYIGLPMHHAASFCQYLQERLITKTGIIRHHLLNGTDEPTELIRRVGGELKATQIDVAFVGIGENGHLAFNDPPADFETKDAYILVNLDEPCRRQQVGEGWFANLSEVPKRAISMSVRQILSAKEIIAVVPDARKAQAVKACIEGPISPMAPASILRTHPDTTIYLDGQSAALLSPATLSALAVAG
jgi:glucosamine-6-phosphate deaminase